MFKMLSRGMDNIKKKNEIQMKLLETVISDMKNTLDDTSLVVPWLSLCTSTAGGCRFYPTCLATHPSHKKIHWVG